MWRILQEHHATTDLFVSIPQDRPRVSAIVRAPARSTAVTLRWTKVATVTRNVPILAIAATTKLHIAARPGDTMYARRAWELDFRRRLPTTNPVHASGIET